jgi:carotene biosynthesis associated membrane protein
MRRFVFWQWSALTIHMAAMLFGLVGLLLVLPNTEFISSLPEFGLLLFSWGMVGGGAVFMILGAIAAFLYGIEVIGIKKTLAFFIPAAGISLGSELLGTSTGFPFGDYAYLSGLGTKIAGLVPFTIPLSWFYMGFVCLLLANISLRQGTHWLQRLEAILLGAMMLTAWDFVLDPAMSQSPYPFWEWHQDGAFFGMPFQNFAGWMLTGAVFMTIASLLWGKQEQPLLTKQQLIFPVLLYASNFAFALILSVSAEIYPPIFLGLLLGLFPVLGLWQMAATSDQSVSKLGFWQVFSTENKLDQQSLESLNSQDDQRSLVKTRSS